MTYPNGQTVSDLKKNVSSTIKSEAKDIQSTASSLKGAAQSAISDAVTDFKTEARGVKSEFQSGLDKKEAKPATPSATGLADTVLSSDLALLPVKNTEEAFSLLQSTVQDVRSSVSTARESATSIVKKYPLYSLLGAAFIGASAVMLLNMRRSSARDA